MSDGTHHRMHTALSPLWLSKRYNDTILVFHDIHTGGEVVRIKTHKVVLFLSEIAYFRRLIDAHELFGRKGVKDRKGRDLITIHLDFGLYTKEMVVTLFEVIYNGFTSRNVCDYIHEYVFYFYQLALYFTFDALLHFCQERLFHSFSLALADEVKHFCCDDMGLVADEKRTLYARFEAWRHYCVLSREPVACSRSMIRYHRNICPDCLSAKGEETFDGHYLFFGGLKSRHRACEFALIRRGTHVSLAVSFSETNSSSSDDDMSLESEESRPSLETRLSLFSKTPRLALSETTSLLTHSTAFGETVRFEPHAMEDCYESVCATCQQFRPVYIVDIQMDVIK